MSRFKFVVMPLLLVLVLSAVSDAQDQKKKRRSQRRRGGRASATSLLRMSQVQAELKLTDGQKEGLKKISRPSLRNVSREERTKKLANYRKTANAIIKKVLKEGQQKRLNQLLLQRQGYRALATAAVAKEVGLSKEQSKKIQTALRSSGGRRTNFRNLSGEDRKKAIAKLRAQSEKREKTVLAVLNDKQKAKFAKMKGKKFKFPSRRRRRRTTT